MPNYFYYDPADRQKGRIDALGGESYFVYDERGWQVAQVDELGRPTYFYYDKAGRRRGTVDAQGNETYYVFDPAGNTVSQVDALGHASYFALRCAQPAASGGGRPGGDDVLPLRPRGEPDGGRWTLGGARATTSTMNWAVEALT